MISSVVLRFGSLVWLLHQRDQPMAKDLNTPVASIWTGGAARNSESGEAFESANPDDDIVFCLAVKGSSKNVLYAVVSAKRAFASYGASLAKDRERWLQKAAEIMENRGADFVGALFDEIGSPTKKATFELHKIIGMLRTATGLCRHADGKTLPEDYPVRFFVSVHERSGVVACVTPFDGPLIKGLFLTARTLAAGNAVVLPPSEIASRVAHLIAGSRRPPCALR